VAEEQRLAERVMLGVAEPEGQLLALRLRVGQPEGVALRHSEAVLEPERQSVTLRDTEPDAEGHCEGERVRVGVTLRDPVAHLEVVGEGEIVAEVLGDKETVA
jgi:Flp pilus assembly protein CpaB